MNASHVLQIAGNTILSAAGVLSLGWLFWHAFKKSAERSVLIFKWVLSGLIIWYVIAEIVPGFRAGGGPAIAALMEMLVVGIVMNLLWRQSIIDAIANPIASLYDGGNVEIEPKPYYSVALSRRMANKPLEAIVVVREQLAKFPRDYEGILLLAAIQAEDTKDLPSAEITLNRFCEWEKAPPKQIAAALTQLADWHLKLAQDTDAAHATLQRIIEKFPDSELSIAAAERIAHLPGVEKSFLLAQDRRPFYVRQGIPSAGLRETIAEIIPPDADPGKLAEELVAHLREHPLDAGAREKLAIIYARHFQRLDLATNELMQLAEQSGQPPKRVAHWLNLLADLQIHGGAEFETVAPTLEKIIEMFPGLPVADLARSRLNYVRLEIKGQKEKSPAVPLGNYEQNIGLKGSRFFSPRQL